MKNNRDIKIFKEGRLVEIIRRPAIADYAPKKAAEVKPTRSRLSRNRRGTNQYETKRKGEDEWKKTLTIGLVLILVIAGVGRAAKLYFEPKIISPLPAAYAQEKMAGESAQVKQTTPTPTAKPTATPNPIPAKEERAKKVQAYLEKVNSPLAGYSEYLVDMADQYDIPWTLVAAISGKESSFCKNIKAGSHNCWGIMTWDSAGNRDIRTFNTWEDGIRFATKLLSENYRHDMNRAIQAKYCPSFECSNTWVNDVTNFQEAINE